MLENYQTINEKGKPRFAVLDFKEFKKIQDLLTDSDKLEDFLDYMHIQKVKKKKEKTYTLEEVKKELKIGN